MAQILITGAARGIGRELVERAVRRGDTVFACVRKEADRSRFAPAPNLHPVLMDVADSASVERAFAEVDRLLAGKPLTGIVHAAAVSHPGAIEVAPMDEFEQTLNTNTLGSLRMLRAAIPRLRGHDGRLVLVTSLWGRASGVLLGAYCASKHAIESLADVARRETVGMGLHIIVAEPGVVVTDMYTTQADEVDRRVAQMSAEQRDRYENLYRRYRKLVGDGGSAAITATKAAENIERALFARKPRVRYRFGMDSKVVCFLNWILPDRWLDALLAVSLNHKPLR
jgi:NAD(P)-dependent dehydrogenase (short-subunit alcohol dehydrogenase family)